MKIKRIVLILGALLTVRVAVMMVAPVFDPSESRYAVLAANMARTGDFLVPHFIHGGIYQSFDGKPPLVFQLGGLFCRVWGESEFAVRLPSLFAALGVLAILFWVVKRGRDTATGLAAVAIAATSAAFFATSGLCMTDMALTFCVAGALLLERAFNEMPRRGLSLAIAALLGVGMLVKGPVALVLFGLPVFVDALVNRRWAILARHAWFSGTLLFLVIAAPWYILAEERTPGFLNYFFVHENFLRFVTPNYGDRYGAGREFFRGMAVIWLVVVTLPWAPLAFLRRGKPKLPARPSFMTLAIITLTGFWCLTSRVPLAYLMPAVPLVAAWLAERIPAVRVFRLLPFAAAISCVVLVGGLLIGRFTSDKLSGRGYRDFAAKYPPHTTFSSVEPLPYSAEFYLGGSLHAKPAHGDVIIERIRK